MGPGGGTRSSTPGSRAGSRSGPGSNTWRGGARARARRRVRRCKRRRKRRREKQKLGSRRRPALVVRYQDALRDLPSVVRRVAAHVSVDLTDAEVRAIAEKCGFAAMRSDLDRFQPISVRWTDPNFAFVRRRAGVARGALHAGAAPRFDAKAREVFGVDEATGAARVPFGAMDD